MFKVIDLSTGSSLLNELGEEQLFETGEEASARAISHSATTGNKWQPRPASKDLNWREREAKRFLDKTYTKLPWHRREFWKTSYLLNEHFAHVSLLKSGMVAFTESAAQGEINKKVSLRPGRYLTRYFPQLSETEVKECCALFGSKHEAPGELLFAETADDIEETYVLGPESCMSNDKYRDTQGWHPFSSPFHPVRVYAAGDLQVAYIRNEKGRITARSLVYPAKKTHSRVYGNITTLSELLYQAGYKFRAPYGAKLLRVNVGATTAVLPYIDKGMSPGGGSCMVQEIPGDDKHLQICETPENNYYEASQLSGLCQRINYRSHRFETDPDDEEPYYTCDVCESEVADGDQQEVVVRGTTTRVWCEDCISSGAFFCSGYEQYYATDSFDALTLPNGGFWCSRYYERYGFACDATGGIYHIDQCVNMADGQQWCCNHFDEHGFFCDGSGLAYPIEERIRCEGPFGSHIYVSRQWALANGFNADGRKIQLSLEIEEQEKEIAF